MERFENEKLKLLELELSRTTKETLKNITFRKINDIHTAIIYNGVYVIYLENTQSNFLLKIVHIIMNLKGL